MIRRPRVCGRTGTKRRRSTVSPSEGNEARREGSQEVTASHSSGEAGERPFRTPWSEGDAALWTGSWNHAEDTVPHQRVTANRPSRARDSDTPQRDEPGALTCTPGSVGALGEQSPRATRSKDEGGLTPRMTPRTVGLCSSSISLRILGHPPRLPEASKASVKLVLKKLGTSSRRIKPPAQRETTVNVNRFVCPSQSKKADAHGVLDPRRIDLGTRDGVESFLGSCVLKEPPALASPIQHSRRNRLAPVGSVRDLG